MKPGTFILFYIAAMLFGCIIGSWDKVPAVSQQTAILPAVTYVTGKAYTPGHYITMRAQTGKQTVTMPYFIPNQYVFTVLTPSIHKIQKLSVTCQLYDVKLVGDTIILKP
jgi:hypothetical protein